MHKKQKQNQFNTQNIDRRNAIQSFRALIIAASALACISCTVVSFPPLTKWLFWQWYDVLKDCPIQGCLNRAKSRGSASRFAIRSKWAPWLFCYSAILFFLGSEGVNLTRPGTTPVARCYAAQATHLHYVKQTSWVRRHAIVASSIFLCYSKNRSNKFLSARICTVKEFPENLSWWGTL